MFLLVQLIAVQVRPLGTWYSELSTHTESHSFGGKLDPRWIVGAKTHSTSELLRTP